MPFGSLQGRLMRCQICNHSTRPILEKEQNVSCGDYFVGRRLYARDIGNVILSECDFCGFAAFDDLQGWSDQKFQQEIYNEDYHLCDPPFRVERPRKISDWLSAVLSPCQVIDYGGGEGQLATMLNGQGFQARSFDPFYGDPVLPGFTADVVTAFEVVEHVPGQGQLFETLVSLCKPDGLIVFSTLLKPRVLMQDWWYASPRNGHVSFHTDKSLHILMQDLKLAHVSISDEIHVAALDQTRLASVKGWIGVQINDLPEYIFGDSWNEMRRL